MVFGESLGNEMGMVQNQMGWEWDGDLHCARSLLPVWQYAYWAVGFLLHILMDNMH